MKRVLWKEGLFLRPQHFQKQDHYGLERARNLYRQQGAHAYGISHFQYVASMLIRGEICIPELEGVMPDGTEFNLSGRQNQLNCIMPDDINSAYLVLSLPKSATRGVHVAKDQGTAGNERYFISLEKVTDELGGDDESIEIEILEPNFKLKIVHDLSELIHEDFLPLMRIAEYRENKALLLDEGFIPPVLRVAAHPVLKQIIPEISGLLATRRAKLLARMGGDYQHGVTGMTEFLLLQLVNRYEPVLRQYEKQEDLHPEKMYLCLISLAGELRTFTSEERSYGNAPLYQHQDLAGCFGQVMHDLREAFNYVFDEPALLIPFEIHKYQLYLAHFQQFQFDFQRLILAVTAEMPLDELSIQFPIHAKVGPTEMIRDLVNLQIPGIVITLLPVSPRQIPYHSGCLYFELDHHSEIGRKLRESPGLALHLGGNFPGVELKLWAIKH